MSDKVLVVNDERHLCRLMEVALQRAGHEVMLAYDGVEALEKVEEFEPDIIILDTIMPRMDGFEVIRRLRADTATEDIPVLLTRPESSDTCSDPMGDYYQTTAPPINPRLLVFCVQRILHGDEGEPVVSRR